MTCFSTFTGPLRSLDYQIRGRGQALSNLFGGGGLFGDDRDDYNDGGDYRDRGDGSQDDGGQYDGGGF